MIQMILGLTEIRLLFQVKLAHGLLREVLVLRLWMMEKSSGFLKKMDLVIFTEIDLMEDQ